VADFLYRQLLVQQNLYTFIVLDVAVDRFQAVAGDAGDIWWGNSLLVQP